MLFCLISQFWSENMSVAHETDAYLLILGQKIYSRRTKQAEKRPLAAAMGLSCRMNTQKFVSSQISAFSHPQNSFLSIILSLTFTDTATQTTITTIIAAAICHPANVFRRWRPALPLQSSSAFFPPAASRKMTVLPVRP